MPNARVGAPAPPLAASAPELGAPPTAPAHASPPAPLPYEDDRGSMLSGDHGGEKSGGPAAGATATPIVAYGASGGAGAAAPAAQREDFVLLSEFSEQEGPVPVMTVRRSALEEELIDFSSFVVRTMAVDHQSRIGEGFVVPEDSSVFLTEPNDKFYAFVHYVTLFDVSARGFVRPICVSYITYDPDKIMAQFEELRSEFIKSVLPMKDDNYDLFLTELKQRYHDLVYTRDILMSDSAKPETEGQDADEGQQGIDRDNIDGFIRETQAMIRVIARRLHFIRSQAQQRARRSMQRSSSSLFSSPSPVSPRSRASTLEALAALGSVGRDDGERTRSDSLSKHLQQPEFQPRFLRFFHNSSRFDAPLRTLERLTGNGFATSVQKWTRILSHFKRASPVLMLEREDAKLILPLSTLLTIGRCPLVNMAEGRLSSSERLTLQPNAEPFFLSRRITVNTAAAREPRDSTRPADDESSLSCSYESARDSMRSSSPPYVDAPDLTSVDDQSANVTETLLTGGVTGLLDAGDSDDAVSGASPVALSGFVRAAQSRSNTISSLYESNTVQQERLRGRDRVVKPMAVGSFADHLWHQSNNKPGAGILACRRKYPFLKQLLFALLKGRPVLVLGLPENEGEIRTLIATLSLFVPGHSSRCQVHPWRTRPLSMPDLARVKLAGLSKRFVLPKNVEAYVSVLDYESESLKTPSYQGVVLDQLVARTKYFSDEHAFLAHVHTVLLEVAIKTYVYYHVCIASSTDSPPLRLAGGSLMLSPLEEMALYPPAVQTIMRERDHRRFLAATERPIPQWPAHAPFAAGRQLSADESPRVETRSTTTTTDTFSAKMQKQQAIARAAHAAQQKAVQDSVSAVYLPLVLERARRLFHRLDVHPHDREIIEYLADVVRAQQLAEMEPAGPAEGAAPIHLDQRRCQVFNSSSAKAGPSMSRAATAR